MESFRGCRWSAQEKKVRTTIQTIHPHTRTYISGKDFLTASETEHCAGVRPAELANA